MSVLDTRFELKTTNFITEIRTNFSRESKLENATRA